LDKLMRGDLRDVNDIEATINFADIDSAKEAVKGVKVDADMRKGAHSLALLMRAQGYAVTTRGYQWIMNAAKATAWLDGRDEVAKGDLIMPFSTCWRTEEHVDSVRNLVETTLVPALKTARDGLSAIRKSKAKYEQSSSNGDAKTSMDRATSMIEVNAIIDEMEEHRNQCNADEQVLIDSIIDEANSIYATMTSGMKRS